MLPDAPAIARIQHDADITIAVGRSRKETHWTNRQLKWSELLQKLSQTHRTAETFGEYQQMTKTQQAEVKDIGGFVGGALKGGRRKRAALGWRFLITLDADFADTAFLDQLKRLDFAWAAYTTHSHSPEHPRYRVVIPLSRALSAEEYEPVARLVAQSIGINYFDDTTYDPVRLMYWPSTAEDGEFRFEYRDLPFLDVDKCLASYNDWRDPSQWPVSSRATRMLEREKKKQGNPLEKPGLVGAFCRTYSVPEAIETFLADIYEPAGNNRYTYRPGTSIGGLVIYDDGMFAMSFHGSDPAGGLLCNAFDLVRIHLFGEQDEAATEGTPVNKLPSYLAMVEQAENDERVKETLHRERLEAIEEDFGGAVVDPRRLFFDDRKRFVPMYMAEWFLHDRHAFVLLDELYIYKDGRYVPGERTFREEATRALQDEFATRRLNETLQYIKNTVSEVSPDEATSMGGYLNLRNGLLNLETLELEPHRPDLRTIIQLPVEYDPAATCPAIDEFLHRVVPEDSLPVIEEMIGYCLQPSMWLEKSFLFHGEGGNGKGTLIAVIEKLFGKENCSHVSLQSLAENRFATAQLFGKLVNLHADIPNRVIEDSSLLKELASGDRIQAEQKHKDLFSFRNRAKLIFSANELPSSKDNSDGFHRRWMIIPFPNKFNDSELRKKLFNDKEMSGLLNRAVAGLKRLRAQNGFTEAPSVREKLKAYREKSDSVYHFLTSYCAVGETSNEVRKQELYDAYRRSCQDWGMHPVSQANFNQKVRVIYPSVYESKKGRTRVWKRLILHPTSDPEADFLS